MSAPRPEGMSDESDWRHWPAESQLARIADGAMLGPDDEIGGCITRQQARTLVGELSRLRADGATLREELSNVTNTLREIRAQQKEDFKRADIAEAEVATLRERVKEIREAALVLIDQLADRQVTGAAANLYGLCIDDASAPKEPTP